MAATKRARRENRAGIETTERIIAAAETLFSTIGFAETSLRELTQRAGCNIAAVNYHFGSMEQLYGVILDRKFRPILQERVAGLDAIEAAVGRMGRPDAEALLASWIDPLLDAFYSPSGGGYLLLDLELQVSRSVIRGEMSDWPRPFNDYQRRFSDAVVRAVPHLSPSEAAWRAEFICACVLPTLRNVRRLDTASGLPDVADRDEFRTAWLRAGIALLGPQVQ